MSDSTMDGGRRSAPTGLGEAIARLKARLLGWRDRKTMDPAFQAWAARFPLTRPFARRQTRQLFDLCAGFVYSQTLSACVELGLFERLADGPMRRSALGPALGLPPDGAQRLLSAAESLGLVELREPRRRTPEDPLYGLGPLGAAALGAPGLKAMVAHHRHFYADLADPIALLRGPRGGTALSRYWAYARSAEPGGLEAETVAAYSELMAGSQPLVAAEVLDAHPLGGRRRLLDFGGGEGVFALEALRRTPGLEAVVFDLPAVAARARARFAREGVADRAEAVGGDFFRDPPPAGADVVSLIRVIHDHDDGPAMALLRTARAALPLGGALLLAEPIAGEPSAAPVGDAYFDFYLAAMGAGRSRRREELTAMLAAAGFANIRLIRTRARLMASVLAADAA